MPRYAKLSGFSILKIKSIDPLTSANLRIHHVIPLRMIFDANKAKKSFQKLDKSLKPISKQPSPKRIHDLRTRTRRVEAVLHALMLDRDSSGKRLLRTLAPIRKKAGKVRDIDVFIGYTVALKSKSKDECLIQLIEHLGSVRVKSVRKLRSTFSAQRKKARFSTKQCAAQMENQFPASKKQDAANRNSSAVATAKVLALRSELQEWPKLIASNLHPFRIKAKELRYILQLAGNDDTDFIAALGDVKDSVGKWHDWHELTTIATDVLTHGSRCSLLQQIRSTTSAKLAEALDSTNAMRKKYLRVSQDQSFMQMER